jgi:hypothetical protein
MKYDHSKLTFGEQYLFALYINMHVRFLPNQEHSTFPLELPVNYCCTENHSVPIMKVHAKT